MTPGAGQSTGMTAAYKTENDDDDDDDCATIWHPFSLRLQN